MSLIDREKTIDFILTDMKRMSWNQARNDAINGFVKRMKKVPEVDVVPRGAYDQTKWERDVAIEQLHSYGAGFGEKADVVRVIRCSACKFIIDREDGSHGCYRHFMDDCKLDDFCSYGEVLIKA